MTAILKAESPDQIISAGKPLICDLFENELSEFANSICEPWQAISEISQIASTTSTDSQVSHHLYKILPVSCGTLQKLLASILCLAPYSMQTECAVSNYNNVRSIHRLSINQETVNSRMQIAINGAGTLTFDPRPCVVKFLHSRQRREKLLDVDKYCTKECIAKFFRLGSSL